MQSVIIADFGTMLGKTSERLVVRGPRPRLELIEGGPQFVLPLDLPPRKVGRCELFAWTSAPNPLISWGKPTGCSRFPDE